MVLVKEMMTNNNWKCSICGKVCASLSGFGQHMSKVHGIVDAAKIKMECAVCGKVFFLKPSHVKRGEHHYCSVKCFNSAQQGEGSSWYGKHHSEETISKMSEAQRGENHPNYGKHLSKEHRENIGKALRGRYVSEETRKKISDATRGKRLGSNGSNWNGGPVQRTCEICGKKFYKQKSQVKYGYGRFCSQKCMGISMRGSGNQSWKGGFVPYGPFWPQQRNIVRNRDDYVCQRCGIAEENLGQELDVHHIKSFRNSHDNLLSNLISLCRKCHMHCEHNPEDCPEPRKHWLSIPELNEGYISAPVDI